jgi:DUF1009 family protein
MIAGAGDFPVMIARQASREGWSLPTVALSTQIAADLTPYCPTLVQCGPGQLSKILRVFRRYNVRQIIIVGKIHKQFLWHQPRLDWRALRVLRRVQDYRDSTLFEAISAELAREGVEVVPQTRVLGHLRTPEGVLGARQPSPREWEDIAHGFAQAKQIVAMDIGQTLVVRQRTVLAVEAVEGTDATIRRGCAAGGRGSVVVKVSRPQQDLRFDVPTVGPQTLHAVIAGQATALAVEAGATFMLYRPQLIEVANAHRVALVGVSETLIQRMVP